MRDTSGQRHIQTGFGVVAFLRGGACARTSIPYPESPAAEEECRFVPELVPSRASHSSALFSLYSASWVAVISSPSDPEWGFLPPAWSSTLTVYADQTCRTAPPH